MRRAVPILLLLALTVAATVQTAAAQARPRQEPASRSGPPHAWLFGIWTGGLFPVLDGMLATDCTTQPTVGFGQDAVAHASLLGNAMAQRVIETVRTSATGAEFRFTPTAADPEGFGCEDPNVLHVARSSNETISFPHCSAFPYPLQRCPR